MISFECCRKCVAPKRYPGCAGTCLDYKKVKEEYERAKERRRKTLQQEHSVKSILYKNRD